ncbi:MAG: DNA-processing protein DprA, partial [Propionicimonas sp.]
MPDTAERDARLALAIVSEPGDRITGTLLATVGAEETLRLVTADTALPTSVDAVEGAVWRGRFTARLNPKEVERVREQGDRHGLRLLIPDTPGWPEGLSDLGVLAPIALWAKGDLGLLTTSLGSRVTIVGARAATGYGEHVTGEFASDLAALPRVVVSGG